MYSGTNLAIVFCVPNEPANVSIVPIENISLYTP